MKLNVTLYICSISAVISKYLFLEETYLSRRMGKSTICIGENKSADQLRSNCEVSFAVTAKLISAYVFATRIVQFLNCLNPKFPAYNYLLILYSLVCVEPGQNQIVGVPMHRLI